MNLIAAGQSLLRASEPFASSGKLSSPIGEALSVITSGASLKRVTLLAEQADASVVLVRADYSAPSESPSSGVSSERPPRLTQDPIDVSWTDVAGDGGSAGGELTIASRPAGGSAYFNPLWQYARTQAGLRADPRGVNLDVRV